MFWTNKFFVGVFRFSFRKLRMFNIIQVFLSRMHILILNWASILILSWIATVFFYDCSYYVIQLLSNQFRWRVFLHWGFHQVILYPMSSIEISVQIHTLLRESTTTGCALTYGYGRQWPLNKGTGTLWSRRRPDEEDEQKSIVVPGPFGLRQHNSIFE